MQNQLTLFHPSWCTRQYTSLFALLALSVSLGCSGMPSRVHPPGIDAEDAAEQAMEIYDTDGNGFIAEDELANASGLNAAMKTLDTNGDGKVSETEIEERILAWQRTKVGLTSIRCRVTMDKKHLEGATVTFEPEGFLGTNVLEAIGTSGPFGEFSPKIPKENRPSPTSPPGLQLGIYKVRISKIVGGQEKIPAKYNTETILGQEVSNDDPAIQRHKVIYELKSK